jgi:hypothetical protein
LDAGPGLTLSGPLGTKDILRVSEGVYVNHLAGTILTIPGSSIGPDAKYLVPGGYNIMNYTANAAVGAFDVTANVPKPITWQNIDSTRNVNRLEPL